MPRCPGFFTLPTVALAGLLAGGCVTTKTYQSAVDEMARLKREDATRETTFQGELKDLRARVANLEKELAAARDELAGAKQLGTARTVERDRLQKDFDESTALVSRLKAQLAKLGQNADKLASEKGQLAEGLANAKARLEELRRQKALAEARAASFNDLVRKLRSMIDSGKLRVVIRDGRMIIALDSDVLFESGRTDLKKDAQAALDSVAKILATVPDRKFLVCGHTDDVPIRAARFASNWELSTARAVEVTRFLISSGMSPKVLAAAGYGEFDPVAPNDTSEGRAKNRRIEIVLMPNLSELPSLEDVKVPAG